MNYKKNFLILIALSNARISALQHSGTYSTGVTDAQKKEFSKSLEEALRRLEEDYSQKEISESTHINNIKKFQEELSVEFNDVLNGGKMRFGVAQKAVNLYLKFLWCLGYVEHEPPHCPVDRVVLEAVDINENWTELDSSDRYKEMITIIKEQAKKEGLSIAQWELRLWSNRP
ncbi:MAG: hypothetical protein K9M75_12775 [Phycisphaerae bacterium]|nr:hypothetical protein [Phycisphaerae bacterium]